MIETTVAVDLKTLTDPEMVDKLITEILTDLIDPELRAKTSSRKARREILSKFGDKAFLYPRKLKFPVIDPSTGEYVDALVYAARIRTRFYSRAKPYYESLIDLADNLYKQINGNISVTVKINTPDEIIDVDLVDLVEILR